MLEPPDLCLEGRAGERRAGVAIAAAAALFVALAVLPEVALDGPEPGAAALHVALAERAGEALARGEWPLDFWHSEAELGFPVLHHEPGLGHMLLLAAHRASGRAVPIATLYRGALVCLLALFPLSLFAGLRRLGIAPLAAAAAAVAAPLVGGRGFGFEAVLAGGGEGIFPEVLGAVLAPLALGECGRAVREGRGIGRGALLLAATFAADLVFGYVVALSLLAFVLAPGERRARAVRLAIVVGAAFLGAAFFLVPALRHEELANRAVSRPAAGLLSLLRGEVLDGGRLPIVTALAAVGLVAAIASRREVPRVLAGLFVAWALVCLGPAMSSAVLPLARDLPFERLLAGVRLFAIALAGLGLFAIAGAARAERSLGRSLAAAAAAALVLAPAAVERGRWLEASRGSKREAKAALERDRDLEPLLAALAALEPGRAYVEPEGPLRALCLLRGIEALPARWHGLSFAADLAPLLRPDDAGHCRAFGVRYLVFDAARAPPPFARPCGGSGRYRIHEVPGARRMGLAEVPFALQFSKRTAHEIGAAWLASGLAARGVAPLLLFSVDAEPPAAIGFEGALARLAAGPPPVEAGTVRESGPWSAEADLARDAFVVLRTSFHPGIRASVDGVPAPVVVVVPGFPAVLAHAGRHAIRFSYVAAPRAPAFLAGALALVLAPILARRLAARPAGPPLRAARAAWIAAGAQAVAAAGMGFLAYAMIGRNGASLAPLLFDVRIFFTYLESERSDYPLLALPLFVLPRLFTVDFAAYAVLFAAEMLLANSLALRIGAARVAEREGAARVPGHLAWWTAFFLVLSPLTVGRFDLAPAALALAAAVTWSAGRPVEGALVAAAGALMKVFPVVVAVPALAAGPGRRRGALALAAALAAGAGLWFALDVPSPLDLAQYHSGRGVEFGSVYAGILLAAARIAGDPVALHYDHGSQNLVTAWAPAAAHLAPAALAVALALVVWRSRRPAARDGVRCAGAAVLAFVLTGKVLSAQYLIWLMPFVAVLGGRVGRLARPIFLAACVATTAVFPWMFRSVLALEAWPFLLLGARNLLLLALFALLLFGPEDEAQRAG